MVDAILRFHTNYVVKSNVIKSYFSKFQVVQENLNQMMLYHLQCIKYYR